MRKSKNTHLVDNKHMDCLLVRACIVLHEKFSIPLYEIESSLTVVALTHTVKMMILKPEKLRTVNMCKRLQLWCTIIYLEETYGRSS